MREIPVSKILEAVKELCIDSNKELSESLEKKIAYSKDLETSPICKGIYDDLLDNLDAARNLDLPICQDTGMAVVFAEVGQEALITGGDFESAVNEGVRQGYIDGFLRKSVVTDPLERKNSDDNTPAFLHTRIVPGDKVKITVAPKGAGSENMSKLKMFTPASKEEDIINFVAETVKEAGGNPCPPVVVGVGIGGDFEIAAILAKKALCRDIAKKNENERYKNLEEKMLYAVNQTGVGAQGFGGDITALAVNIEYFATHIACLPVAVNMGCHATRHKTAVI